MERSQFIQNIRTALGHPARIRRPDRGIFPQRTPKSLRLAAARARTREPEQRKVLLERLKENAGPINLEVIVKANVGEAAQSLAALAAAKKTEWGEPKQVVAWDHPLVRELNLGEVLDAHNIPIVFTGTQGAKNRAGSTRKEFRRNVAGSYIGVTSADYCVADTATLVMKARPGEPRSVSLLPSIHVAVIKLDRLIADLGELYALLGSDSGETAGGLTNCMTLISGPSKTADIEATMVHGAHGPKEVHLIVIV